MACRTIWSVRAASPTFTDGPRGLAGNPKSARTANLHGKRVVGGVVALDEGCQEMLKKLSKDNAIDLGGALLSSCLSQI